MDDSAPTPDVATGDVGSTHGGATRDPLVPSWTPDGSPLSDASIHVVGGGIGGLSAAAYLAAAGADVTVIERGERPGGVANRLEVEGFRFDTGPTWYLMPGVFERFFRAFDRRPADYYDLRRLDPHYRVFWKDGDDVGSHPDVERTRRVFESYEEGAGDALADYLAESRRTYEVGMETFVYPDRSRWRDLLDPAVLRAAPGVSLLGSMADHVDAYFDHPKLHQLLQYTLVFLGGSPHNTPALYNLMTHVDYDQGVYYPRGGMYAVVEALTDLGRELGVTYRTGTTVTGIDDASGGLSVAVDYPRDGGGVDTAPEPADAVVANANPVHVDRDLLPAGRRERAPGYWRDRTYAPSAFLLYLGVEGPVDPLAHHTLVFPTDWDPHFESIFEDPAWPDDPAYYLAVPSKTDDSVAPDGHHAVVVLVPIAPGLEDGPDRRRRYRDRILADLSAATGVDLRDRVVVEESACVREFARRYDAPGGTALGLAHTLLQTGPFRPSHRSTALDGLYYAGGYTGPGIGVPMTLISGEHAARAVVADRDPSGGPRSLLPV